MDRQTTGVIVGRFQSEEAGDLEIDGLRYLGSDRIDDCDTADNAMPS